MDVKEGTSCHVVIVIWRARVGSIEWVAVTTLEEALDEEETSSNEIPGT